MTKVAEDITEIKTDMKWVIKTLENHMSEHTKVKLMMYGSVLGMITAVVLAIVI